MDDSSTYKISLQFVNEGKSYDVSLFAAEGEEDAKEINIGGKRYTSLSSRHA